MGQRFNRHFKREREKGIVEFSNNVDIDWISMFNRASFIDTNSSLVSMELSHFKGQYFVGRDTDNQVNQT